VSDNGPSFRPVQTLDPDLKPSALWDRRILVLQNGRPLAILQHAFDGFDHGTRVGVRVTACEAPEF
jgi:hypothetical protein